MGKLNDQDLDRTSALPPRELSAARAFSAPKKRLGLGDRADGAHLQHRDHGFVSALEHTPSTAFASDPSTPLGTHLQPSPDADRSRPAKAKPIPPGARPTADAPRSILTPHPSKFEPGSLELEEQEIDGALDDDRQVASRIPVAQKVTAALELGAELGASREFDLEALDRNSVPVCSRGSMFLRIAR